MKFYTPSQLADLLHLKKADSVRGLIHSGAIEASNIGSPARSRWVVSQESLDRILATRSNRPDVRRKRKQTQPHNVKPFYR